MPVRIVGGARTIRLERPAGVPLGLTVQGGAGRIEFDGRTLGRQGGQVTIEPPGWGAAGDRFRVDVVGGAKEIEVVEW